MWVGGVGSLGVGGRGGSHLVWVGGAGGVGSLSVGVGSVVLSEALTFLLGFTPMVKIITAALGQHEEMHVTLLFANRTEKDILWQAKLEQLQEAFTTR